MESLTRKTIHEKNIQLIRHLKLKFPAKFLNFGLGWRISQIWDNSRQQLKLRLFVLLWIRKVDWSMLLANQRGPCSIGNFELRPPPHYAGDIWEQLFHSSNVFCPHWVPQRTSVISDLWLKPKLGQGNHMIIAGADLGVARSNPPNWT